MKPSGDLSVGLQVSLPPEITEAIARQVVAMLEERRPRSASGWLDVAGAAEYLRCEPQRIYDLVSQKRLPVAKEGSRSLFRVDWLDALVEIKE